MTVAHRAARSAAKRRLLGLAGSVLAVASLAAASLAVASLALASLAAASSSAQAATATRNCGGVSYSFNSPAGGIAFNKVVAVNVSCATAKSVALDFLKPNTKLPAGWHQRHKSVLVGGQSQTYEFFTKGNASVIGEDEAG